MTYQSKGESMNRDKLISMARQAGASQLLGGDHVLTGDKDIEYFAELVASAERKAIAEKLALENQSLIKFGAVSISKVDAVLYAEKLREENELMRKELAKQMLKPSAL